MVELTVEVGRTRMTLGQTLALGPGSVVTLDRLADKPVDLLVNGRPIARGEVVVIDEEFGLRITEVTTPRSRPPSQPSAASGCPSAFAIQRLWTFVLKPVATAADDWSGLVPPESVRLLRIPPFIYGAASRPSAWCCSHRPARSPRPATGENTPLSLPADSGGQGATAPRSGSGSLVRTFVGLAIVLAVIYGLAWVLKQVKRSKEDRGAGHEPRDDAPSCRSAPTARCTSSAPAASSCSSASPSTASRRSAPTPRTRRSTLGLLDEDESDARRRDAARPTASPRRRRALAGPPQGPDGAAMKGPDGTNAVQLLLLVGGADARPGAAVHASPASRASSSSWASSARAWARRPRRPTRCSSASRCS